MKRLLLILILTLSLQSWAKADDIKDFQIEGITIGESLLDSFTEEELIKQFKGNIYNYPKSKRIYETWLSSINTEIYDEIQVSLISGDKNYIVQNIN